ncbi:MAG TPA: DinB family protein [Parafilimonas sp.]|nr:DinB family protein [Parafilimonas sp.]
MNELSLGKIYLKELEAEIIASRKCLERIPGELFSWKPHEKSMELGYLALLVAEIPRWIATMINEDAIDFATFKHIPATTTDDLLAQFDGNITAAKEALQNVSNEQLNELFSLKTNGHVIFSSPKNDNVSSTINHWVHHRGQLTVYMRLNDIPVPSIYGPSADDKNFG